MIYRIFLASILVANHYPVFDPERPTVERLIYALVVLVVSFALLREIRRKKERDGSNI
jgi:hypothetical protein